MAIITNTFQSPSAEVNREQLMNVVHRVAPEDTPIYSSIPKGKAGGTHEEWVTDDLAAPEDNAQLEGDEFSYTAITPAGRPGNYTQILRKSFLIADSQEAVENAANVEKMRYQTLRKGIEIRKDVEYSIIGSNASASGTTRKSASFATWVTTNDSRGSSGADGGLQSSGLTAVPTNGTQRAFAKGLMDDVMQNIYESGGTPRVVSMSPYVKSVFVALMNSSGTAEFRSAARAGASRTIIATADMYEGPFGTVRVMPNRVQAAGPGGNRAGAGSSATNRMRQNASNAHFVDPQMMSWLWLRPIHRVPNVAKTGDATKRVILGEGTLCVKNEKAHGILADLFGVSATT